MSLASISAGSLRNMSAMVSPALRPIEAIAPATCADFVLISCGVNSWSPNDNVGNTGAYHPSLKNITVPVPRVASRWPTVPTQRLEDVESRLKQFRHKHSATSWDQG